MGSIGKASRLLALVLGLAAPVAAQDRPGAHDIVMFMFNDACGPSTGNAKGTRDWIAKNSFRPVDNAALLRTLVGALPDGAAWRTLGPDGPLFVTLDSRTSTCGVWAQSVDPARLEALFRGFIDRMKRDGLSVVVEKEETFPTRTGSGKALVYRVVRPERNQSLLFALNVADKPGSLLAGAPQQAVVQVTAATLTGPDADMDPNALLLFQLSTQACRSDRGNAAGVRAWANDNYFRVINDRKLLDTLVGDGEEGAAWSTRSLATGRRFAVSLRGKQQSCAVWVDGVDPVKMENLFRALMERPPQPGGVSITLDRDETLTTTSGQGKQLLYRLVSDNPKLTSFLLMTVSDKPGSWYEGTPYQARILSADTQAPTLDRNRR